MIIRKINKKDLNQCANILKKEYSKEPYNEIFVDNNEFNYIESKYKCNKNTSFVIEEDNKILWFCFVSFSFWVDWPQWIIEEIVIDSNYQWKWIWKKIYLYIENYFKEQWVKSLMLWVKNNAGACHFHEKNWFSKSNEHSVMFKNL